ncbi:WbqC-like protein [Belliella baltica DSM 15883]|uniref:WbqC-like protein n=1 Tax=Belliella baltica (strain DSM 15883 / CIP 108006 / LMG 21964 / BA134) TaxID=866536 RepID=I3Z742_BELBD|nr:WbqC family protein [Belliella baltica]AFL85060.1 WbqC-like protein [Belliella baltica DSM 15883]
MKVAISQSNYIPWKGYFDLINSVDHFIFYDDIQYTKRDWRNRNIINTSNGSQWLTIPVSVKGKYEQKISETTTVDNLWKQKHLSTLLHAYKKAPFFGEIYQLLRPLYEDQETNLSKINQRLILSICAYLGINTKLSSSSEYVFQGNKTEKLINIIKQVGGKTYLTGPAARSYIDESLFQAENITLRYFEYGPYPIYDQLNDEFNHQVSIVDLLFFKGPNSGAYIFKK